jgi:Conjugative relaxosome accessory transposon protein.
MSKPLSIFFGFVLSGTTLQAAGLERMFERLGASSNHTGVGSFHDQAGGHYSAGGLVVRQKNTTIHPITIQLPDVGMNCGDIDMVFGAFSFVSKEELAKLLKGIGKGAPTYALQLAMKTIVPQVEGTLTQIRTMVQHANNMMLEECRLMQDVFDGALISQGVMREQLCRDLTKAENKEDWFGASAKCDEFKKQTERINQEKKPGGKYENMMAGEFNLVWHVLQKMPEYKDNQVLAEFVMTVVGTVISRQNDGTDSAGEYSVRTISPRGDQMEFLTAYLKGGKVSHLHCEDMPKCLKVKLVPLVIDDEQSMNRRVLNKIATLKLKYKDAKRYTPDEMAFLGDAVGVPLYKYIQVSTAAKTEFSMNGVSDYIALSVLLHQFSRITDEILEAVEELEKIQLDRTVIEDFKFNLQAARANIQHLFNTVDSQAIWRLTQQIKATEQVVVSQNQ